MKLLQFGSDVLPPAQRLPAFQQGAVDYMVSSLGDPLDFAVSWRLLALGEINLVHSRISPVRYCRDRAQVEDGADRVSLLYVVAGHSIGEIDGQPVSAQAGDALIFDLTRTLDTTADAGVEMVIVTMPRRFLEEALPTPWFRGLVPAGPALELAVAQTRAVMERAADLPDAAAAFTASALRDLFAMAMLPAYRCLRPMENPSAPLLQRLCDAIDRQLAAPLDADYLAGRLTISAAQVQEAADRIGGLDKLVERRRLLAAFYQLKQGSAAGIAQVAAACGFPDPADFSRRFSRLFQASPRDLTKGAEGVLPTWAGAYSVPGNYGALRQIE